MRMARPDTPFVRERFPINSRAATDWEIGCLVKSTPARPYTLYYGRKTSMEKEGGHAGAAG